MVLDELGKGTAGPTQVGVGEKSSLVERTSQLLVVHFDARITNTQGKQDYDRLAVGMAASDLGEICGYGLFGFRPGINVLVEARDH